MVDKVLQGPCDSYGRRPYRFDAFRASWARASPRDVNKLQPKRPVVAKNRRKPSCNRLMAKRNDTMRVAM